MRQDSSILPDALMRELRSRTGRETVSIKEYYETDCVCAASVNGSSARDKGDTQHRAERSEYERHLETLSLNSWYMGCVCGLLN